MVMPSLSHDEAVPPEPGTGAEVEQRLLQTLAGLNQIGASINRIGPESAASIDSMLGQIVENAARVVPDTTAVIYLYDETRARFDRASRVSAGAWDQPISGDEPRTEGLGWRAITQRRRVLSYTEPDLTIHPLRAELGVQVVGCFPLVVDEQALGALYVYRREAHPFSQLELLMLDNFVNQAAMAIYHARRQVALQRSLAHKEEEIRQLRRAGLLISSHLRLQETLEAILQMALEVTHAHYGIFRLLDKSGQHLITGAIAADRLARPRTEALPLDAASVMGWVAAQREPVRISDLRAEPWASHYYQLDGDIEMRSELAVPLINAGGRLEGVLNLESPEVDAFTEDDSHLLRALAAQAVIAIQEVRLLDALQMMAQWLLIQPCQEVLERLALLACDLLNAADGAIWIRRGDELFLEAASSRHLHVERIPLHNSLIGLVVLDRTPIMTNDVRTDARFNQSEIAREQGWERALIVPVMAGPDDELLGAFSVYSASPVIGHFAESDWDKKVLICLAHYAALALQNEARQEALRAMRDQQAVAETFAVVGDIASNLLHYLNNKVGTIPARVQGIRAKSRFAVDADPYMAHNLKQIESCAVEAMAQVRETLAHLRPIQPQPTRVAACVQEAIRTVTLPQTVHLQIEALESLPLVMAGERSLVLVFMNLLENASEAMRGSGTITVSGVAEVRWVEIRVGDTGPGILPAAQAHIFELHYSDRAINRPGKLGFGLWWIKTLLTRLGGTVTVYSDGQRGTTFHLRLPRAEVPA